MDVEYTVTENLRCDSHGYVVQINYELEREILGFGDAMIVLKPQALKDRIWNKLRRANKHYEE